MDITIAILAGGESRRMGRDKARLAWQGMTFLEHIARAALAVTSNVIVAGRECPSEWPLPSVPFLPDAIEGEGPLRGLEAALYHANLQPILLTACDMPLLSSEALRWLWTQAQTLSPSAHGLVTVNDGAWEPLFSVYAPACLPALRDALALSRRSLQKMIAGGNFAFVDAPDWIQAQMVNVNTPDEFDTLTQSRDNP